LRKLPAYAEINIEDDNTGLKSGCPDAAMPYSVSVPMTFGMAMTALYPGVRGTARR
jgi:hypothetical protein